MSNLTKCPKCKCEAPLKAFSNDKVIEPNSGYLIIRNGQRCGFCGQVYDSNGQPVDMSKVKMRCGCRFDKAAA